MTAVRWILLLVVLMSSLSVRSAHDLVFGVYLQGGQAEAEQRWMPLVEHINQQLDGRVSVRLRPFGLVELEMAVRRGEVDVVLTNPAHFIAMRQAYPLSGALATLIEEEGGVASAALGGVIFTRADRSADLRELRDLRRKRVLIQDSAHVGGYLAPVQAMRNAGVDVARDLELIRSARSQSEVIEGVLEGQADAGFVRTGVLERLVALGRLDWADVHVLNRQLLPGYPFVVSTRLYPEWPVMAMQHVDPKVVGQFAAALLSLDAASAAARVAGIQGFALPADYLPVEELMRELRVQPFDAPPSFTWRDIWARHAPLILVAALALGLVLVALVGLILGRRSLIESQRALIESEQRLDLVLKGTDVGTWDWNVSTGEVVLNEQWARMLGYGLLELGPMDVKRWLAMVHSADRALIETRLQAHFDGELTQFQCESRIRHRDGHWVWVEDRGKIVEWSSDGRPSRMAGTHADISERKQADVGMRLAASVFAATQEGILISDADNMIVDVNPAFCAITGYTREDVIGRNPAMLSSGRHGAEFYHEMWAELKTTGNWRGEIWNRRKSGDIFPEHLSITAVRDDSGQTTHHVAVLSDISYLKEHEQELRRLAHYDPLTGLPNRRLLADRVSQGMAHTRRRSDLMAIVVLDLDGFKPINDHYGHEVGDRVLKQVARRLRDTLRGGDTAARLGGDEFVLVLLNLTSKSECMHALGRIQEALSAPLSAHGPHAGMSVTASLGATIFPIDDGDADTLLRHADQAMYLAKQEGRNRYHVFDADKDREVKVMREGMARFTRGLDSGELVLFYQPRVDMISGEVKGVEALLRWSHPERGILAPAEFLPLVDGTEYEVVLGRWVIESALMQMRQWIDAGLRLMVSINLSVRHFMHANFVSEVYAALARYQDVPPALIEFEILESEALDDWEHATHVVAECRKLGVSFALDDFGTGYSSLVQLRRLHAQTLKIDQHFVRDMLDDPDDFIIVESVVRLCDSFRLEVVAEGVETEAHAAALVALGCATGQGYGIARPMAAGAFPEWQQTWQARGFWRGLQQVERTT